jgi:hypothetical protein
VRRAASGTCIDAPTCMVDGIVTFANGTNGIQVTTNSNLTLRNSYSSGNLGNGTLTNPTKKGSDIPTGHGIYVGPADGISVAPISGPAPRLAGNDGNDSTHLDLGTDTGANAGHNYFQDATHPNANMGVCWLPTSTAPAQALNVAGNKFDTAAGQSDCTTATTALIGDTDCTKSALGMHVIGIASGAVGPIASDFNAGSCTVPSSK